MFLFLFLTLTIYYILFFLLARRKNLPINYSAILPLILLIYFLLYYVPFREKIVTRPDRFLDA